MKTPILGGLATARSLNAANNRLINLYPEAIPEGGKTPGFLSRCPGLDWRASIGSGPIRGMIVAGNFLYVVSGIKFYKVSASFAVTELGTVTGTDRVSLAYNGTQIFLACNPDGFVYNDSTGAFGQITDPDFPGAVVVAYLDGYFVFNEPDSQRIWVTSLLDGTAIDPLEYKSAIGNPDNVVSLIVDHKEVWILGTNSIEVWYNSAALDYPLDRISGAFIETGCTAPYSVAKLDNSIFWLGSDIRGVGIVYRANGYNAVRVSNSSIETLITSLTTTSDAVAFSYQQAGHSFYVLSFPTEVRTLVFDASTNLWHERSGWLDSDYIKYKPTCHTVFNQENIVGTYENELHALSLSTYQDKWLRSWRAIPTGQNTLIRTKHYQLQLDCEVGVGLVPGQGDDPQIMLRWSDDGGHTWSNEHWASLGKLGETTRRVIWRRLGMTRPGRDRIYEVSGTDPVNIIILGAELLLTPCTS